MIDLLDILYRQRSVPRGDELEAHITDLWGCDRATWYRRQGLIPPPEPPEKQAKFQAGHDYEHGVVAKLREAGFDVEADGFEVSYLGLIGHPDAVIMNQDENGARPSLLIETKTTDSRKPDAEAKSHHAVQASAYALAVGAPEAVVLVKHASHIEAAHWINPEGYRFFIERRAKEILERTHPDAPMPPPDGSPPELEITWTCQYCPWAQCERNPNYEQPIPTLVEQMEQSIEARK